MELKVFIQNEAGSSQKHIHDEKTLEWKRTVWVSRPYPFPYGFILDTTAEDGWNVDCFVLTAEPLKTGQIVTCEAAGLMELFDSGEEDHNVLARLPGEAVEVDSDVQAALTDFVEHVFEHIAGKEMRPGRFLGREAAEAHVRAHRDETEGSHRDQDRKRS